VVEIVVIEMLKQVAREGKRAFRGGLMLRGCRILPIISRWNGGMRRNDVMRCLT
jgi:hypothetical protein